MLSDCILLNLLIPIFIYLLQVNGQPFQFVSIAVFSAVINILWFLFFNTFQLYSFFYHSDIGTYFLKLVLTLFILWMFLILLIFIFQFSPTILSNFSFYILMFFAAILLIHLCVIGFYYVIAKQQRVISRAIILGYNNTSKKLAEYLQRGTHSLQVVGYIDDTDNVHELSALPVFDGLANSVAIAKSMNINEIYSTLDPDNYPAVVPLIKQSENACIRFHFVSNVSNFLEQGMVVDHLHHLSICSLRKDPLKDTGNRIFKRLFDVIISLFVIIFILSWLTPLLAILIKLSSDGPVLFKQKRSGLSDKPFCCYKFRTMKTNDLADLIQATKNDQRVTRIGAFLRKTSLDEFPQFFNVFKGDMSIVGPRPHMIKHTESFAQLTEQYMIRHLLKPGITGWAQVNGFRGEIVENQQIERRIACDIWYLENWNLYLDFKIVLLTFWGIFKRNENAY